jgi:valyl-tRNA synthetase
VAPLAGKHGESISLQPYPAPDVARHDADATSHIALLKALVDSCRSLRSEMNLSPALRLDALIAEYVQEEEEQEGEGEEEEEHIGALDLLDYVAALAKLSDIRIVNVLPRSYAPVQIVNAFRVMLDVKVDLAAERERIRKEIARLEVESVKDRTKLGNEIFIARAPASVVEEVRGRLAGHESALAKYEEQLGRLSG